MTSPDWSSGWESGRLRCKPTSRASSVCRPLLNECSKVRISHVEAEVPLSGEVEHQARSTPEKDLAALLDSHRDEIAGRWAGMIGPRLLARSLARSPAHVHAIGLRRLDDLISTVTRGTHASDRGPDLPPWRVLMKHGFDLSEVVEGMMLLKEAVLPIVWRSYHRAPRVVESCTCELDSILRRAVTDAARAWATEAERHLQEQRRSPVMLELTEAVSFTLDLDEVLQRVSCALASIGGLLHCSVYPVQQDEGTDRGSIYISGTNTRIARATDSSTDMPPELPDDSLVHMALKDRRPCTAYNVRGELDAEQTDAREARSRLVVPFVLKERVVAVACIDSFDSGCAFTEEQVKMAWGVASAVAPAIEMACLHQRMKKVAVEQERAWLAQELHDDLAQEVGLLNLKVADAHDLLSAGQASEAEAALTEAVQIAGATCQHVREVMFGLRRSLPSGVAFLPALREFLAEYQVRYGVQVTLVVDDERAAIFTPRVATQVSRVILEALTNVRKHAHAGTVWIRIEQNESHARIAVEDDGRGFALVNAAEPEPQHFGLQIMRERAESVGGTLQLGSRPGGGAQVVIVVPRVEA